MSCRKCEEKPRFHAVCGDLKVILTEALSILRHGSSNVLSENVVKELLAFLSVVYSEGNLTSVAKTNKLGPLDI